MTCAGPFGVEAGDKLSRACVRTAGAPACFLGLLLTMTGYVLPQILMTSELSMMPPLNNGGVTAWVARAFGARVGECVGLNMLLYQIVDLATYTTVVTGYAQSGGYEVPSWLPTLAPFLVILLGLAVNLLALDVATEFLGASLL
ncbi:unnamed protein product, partial [Symbiodinium microadriaticum]